MAEFKDLLGETLTDIDFGKTEIIFTTDKGVRYKMYHEQECCESVDVDEVEGGGEFLGTPVLQADMETNEKNPKSIEYGGPGRFLWTFYRLATIKGSLVIRWYGESNGYYGVEVSFEKV